MKVKIVRPWLWTIRTPLLVPAALMALALVDVAARNAGAQPGAIVLTLAFAGYVALIPSLLALALDAPLASECGLVMPRRE